MNTLFSEPKAAPKQADVMLRPYQRECLKQIDSSLAGFQSSLFVMPTGTGKTIIFADKIKREDGRVIVLAHQEKLLKQASDKIHHATGIRPDIEQGGYWADGSSKIIVATWQTMHSGMDGEGRRTRFNPSDFSLIVTDEAHRAVAPSYERTVAWFASHPECKILGCTATPDRTDEKALGRIYDDVCYEYWLHDAIPDGWLVPIRQVSRKIHGLDWSQVKCHKDISEKDLGRYLEEEGETLHAMVSAAMDSCAGKKSLYFWPRVSVAHTAADICNRFEPNKAAVIHGGTSPRERFEIYRQYRRGEILHLHNVGIATEGFDEPSVENIVIGRPTKSRALFAQMCGRATRPLTEIVGELNVQADSKGRRQLIAQSDKPRCQIIDFVGASSRLKLCAVVDILGGNYNDDVVEAVRRKAEEQGDANAIDVESLLEEELEERKKVRQLEQKKRQPVKARTHYSDQVIDIFDRYDVRAPHRRGWDSEMKPTQKQLDTIKKMTKKKVDCSKLTRKECSAILDKLIGRAKHGFCSDGQARVLERYGFDPTGIRFTAASRIIDAISQAGWKECPESVRQEYAKHLTLEAQR